jgi:glycosyltransferase involved in cell wall biosynthesis
MKSVCILLQHYYDLDIRVRRKAEALIAAGYSVDVLALRGTDGAKNYTLDGVTVYTISLGKKRGSLMRYVFEYSAFIAWALLRLTVLMPKRRYALIDVNTLPDFLVFAAIFAKWMGAKVVLDMHEITPEFYISKYGIAENSGWIPFLKYLEKISFNFADRVITINEPIEDLLVSRGLPRRKSTVIMNSADESRFAMYSQKPTAVDEAGGSKQIVMMYHGTLTRIYGLDLAIEAFALSHQLMPAAELWILGSGPEQDALSKLVQVRGLGSKVKLVGQVPPDTIPEWLSKCDIGVLPIRSDIFLEFASPNKLPEFIVMGKPVIISRLRGIRYYFSEDALAYCAANDPTELAKQMVRLYSDRGLRNRLAAKARQEYGPIRWVVMKERYLRLIEDMIGPARVQAELSRLPQSASVPQ